MADKAHTRTDRLIKASEKEFIKIYSDGFRPLKSKIAELLAKMAIGNGMTASEILTEINKYNRFDTLLDLISEALFDMNSNVVASTRERLAEIYRLNYDFTAGELSKAIGIDIRTVKKSEAKEEAKGSPFTQIAIDRAKNKRYIRDDAKSRILKAFIVGGTAASIMTAVKDSVNHNLRQSTVRMTTEATRVENTARNDVAKHVDERTEYTVVEIWRTQKDKRVRNAHARTEGQTVQYDKPFVVGGEELDFPGDMRGSPSNIVGCRCYIELQAVKKRE